MFRSGALTVRPLKLPDMTEETSKPADIPPPTMLTVIAGIALAELEVEFPGLMDRMIRRLGSETLHASVIRLRGARAAPAVIEAQAEALAWLTALAPLLRAEVARPKRKRRA